MRDLPPPLFALVFFVALARAANNVIDFSFYPSAAQTCLYQASNSSSCATGTVAATNTCLCNNGGNFVTNTAKCLGVSDPADLSGVYSTMQAACSDSKTPLSVTEQQYLYAAGLAATTLTSARPTATTASTASSGTSAATTQTLTTSPGAGDDGQQQPGPNNKGLSSGAMAGIIAGASIAGIALLAGLVFFFLRHRRRRDGEESHPMLPQDHGPPIHTLLPTAAEAGVLGMASQPGPGGHWPDDAKWRPTVNSADSRGFNWESPYDLAYQGDPRKQKLPLTPSPPPRPHRSSPRQSEIYELVGSDHLPAEVPGSGSTMIEMEGSPVPTPALGAGPWDNRGAADTSYPPQAARRTSR